MKYTLPKGYLSWSQLSLWETNKQKYIEQYIEGKKGFENKEMKFGKYFAECLEKKSSDDPLTQHLINLLPKRRFEEAEIEVYYEGIKLRGVFDSADTVGFEEYKTGKVPWTMERAKNHGQLDFYGLMFFEKQEVIPEIALHWLPTFQDTTELCFTGEIHSFIVVKNLEHFKAMGERIKKAAEEITNYKQYAKNVVTI